MRQVELSHSAACLAFFGSIRTEQFDDLVVDAQKQECRGPFADKQCLVFATAYFQDERCDDRSTGEPEKCVGWKLGSLLLDGSGNRALALFRRSEGSHDELLF